MSLFQKYYHTSPYDSDYDANAYKPPDEDDEPDTLNESVPSECLFTNVHDILKPVKCTCGWFCELPESHVEHSKWSGCAYINSKYDLSYDSEGELIACPKDVKPITKKPTKKQPKDGLFDICGRYGKDLKKCSCFYCTGYIKDICIEDGWYATKLNVKFNDKELAKSKGALWSTTEKCWYTRASSPHYKDLVDRF